VQSQLLLKVYSSEKSKIAVYTASTLLVTWFVQLSWLSQGKWFDALILPNESSDYPPFKFIFLGHNLLMISLF